MKVIDLLNKIANGKEIPKVIKVHNNQYKWKDGLYIYASGSGQLCFDYFIENNKLNDEIEIIEEDKKIKKITSLNNVANCQNLIEFEDKQQLNNHILKDKINEIIDKLNAGVDKE